MCLSDAKIKKVEEDTIAYKIELKELDSEWKTPIFNYIIKRNEVLTAQFQIDIEIKNFLNRQSYPGSEIIGSGFFHSYKTLDIAIAILKLIKPLFGRSCFLRIAEVIIPANCLCYEGKHEMFYTIVAESYASNVLIFTNKIIYPEVK